MSTPSQGWRGPDFKLLSAGISCSFISNYCANCFQTIQNVDKSAVEASTYEGKLVFHDLHLEEGVLDQLGLPLEITESEIKTLEVLLPWHRDSRGGLRLTLVDVTIGIYTKDLNEFEGMFSKEREQKLKERLLAAFELSRTAKLTPKVPEEQKESKSWFSGLIDQKVELMAGNTQIFLKNITIRYTDHVSAEHKYSAEIHLENFEVLSSNPNKEKEEGYNDDINHVFKKSNLEAFSIRMDVLPSAVDTPFIQPDDSDPAHFILSPVNGEADFEVNKLATGINNPTIKVFPRLSNIQLNISEDQYKTLLQSLDWFAQTQVLKSNLKYRPKRRISEGESPKLWWEYVANAIRHAIRDRQEQWTWSFIARRKKAKTAYMRLFAKNELKIATPAETQELSNMEKELSVADIMWFRTVTRRYLQMLRHEEEKESDPKVKKEAWVLIREHLGDFATKDLNTAPSSGGWLSMLSWVGTSAKKEDPRWEGTAEEVEYVLGWQNSEDEATTTVSPRSLPEGVSEPAIAAHSELDTSKQSADVYNPDSTDIVSYPTESAKENGSTLPEFPQSYAAVASKSFSFGIEHISPHPHNANELLLVDLRLLKGSLTLRRGRNKKSNASTTLAAISFSGFRPILRVFTQPNEADAPPTWEFTSTLAKLIVTDESNPLSKFKKIVQAPRPTGDDDGSAPTLDLEGNNITPDFDDPEIWGNPLLSLNAAQLSPKTGFNLRVEMRLEESLIFYHRTFVEEIVRFAKPPDKHETLNALFDAMMAATKEYASETIDSLRIAEQPLPRSALEFAITETKANIIQLDLKAPLIIIPEDVTDIQSNCIGLDFGRLSIKNAIKDPLSLSALKKLSFSELHDRAAEIYSIDVENVQVAMSGSVPSLTRSGAEGWDDLHHVVPKISLKSFAKLAFRPPKTVPRAEISAIAEGVSADISDTQFKTMRMMLLQLIPHFGDESPAPLPNPTLEERERKVDPIYTESEIALMRSREAYLLALQLDVTRARAEITTNTKGEMTKGADRFLFVDADGLKVRTRVYAYNYWAEAELHGAIIFTADTEPLLISDSELPIVKISYEDKLVPIPMGPTNKIPPRILRCDIGKVVMNVPERIWEFVDEAQKLVELRPSIPPSDHGSDNTLPPELFPQDETIFFLDVDDVQVALWEKQTDESKKIATLNLEALQMKYLQTSPDAVGDDDVILRKMNAMVQRFTCRHHLHEDIDGDEMCLVLDFGRGKKPATIDYTQYDRTSPRFPGWATSVNANITQDILFNLDQDPLSHILRYIIKVQSRKPPLPVSPHAPPPPDNGLSEFKFDVQLQRIVANLFKPGTFRSHSKDHISLEIGNISAHDLIHPTKKLPTLGKVNIDPITIHSKTFENGKVEEFTILSEATVKMDALLEKVMETDIQFTVAAMKLRPYQLRMVLDLLGVIGRTFPLAMQAKDALAGIPPPAPVAHDPSAEAQITGKYSLHLSDLDVDLISGRSNETMLGLRLPDIQLIATTTSDGDITVLMDLESFRLMNPRSEYFRDIVPASTQSPHQLSVRAILPQNNSRPMEVLITLVEAEIILDVDAIVSVLSEVLSFKSELQELPKSNEPSGPLPLIELTMQSPRFTILEDSSDPYSGAVTASADFIALDTTDDSLLKVLNACMYQHKMRREDEPLLFVDSFGVDAYREDQKWKCTIDPIVLRISPREVRFALSLQKNIFPKFQKIGQLLSSPPVVSPTPNEVIVPEIITKILTKSLYQVQFGGFRLVFIGDMPEIPILDMKVREFTIDIQTWDNFKEINALTSTIATTFNMYNFAKSKWEPVIEPWEVSAQFGLHQPPSPQIELNISSGKRLDLVVSTRTVDMIALLQRMLERILDSSISSSSTFGKSPSTRVPTTAPYRIINRTGASIIVWSDKEHPGGTPRTKIENEGSIAWRFDSWRTLRENINMDTEGNLLNIKLEGTPYNHIGRVPVNVEAYRPYRLKPIDTKIPHHVLCEVRLGQDNVKEVIVRSTYLIENSSMNELELLLTQENGQSMQVNIDAGEDYVVPVLLAQSCRIQIRPPYDYGYDWSGEPFRWRDFLRHPTKNICCRSSAAASFNLIVHAIINNSIPLASRYPFMTLRISTPLKLVNLLPHDIKYNLYDKRLQERFVNTIRMGESSPVHSVELSHLLLLSVEIGGVDYEGSEYSVINADDSREFKRESRLNLKDKRGGSDVANAGGALAVSIYAPYLVWNMTAVDMEIKSKSFLRQVDIVSYKLRPKQSCMFSYDTDDRKNRALIKVGKSGFSPPQSFEAVGQASEIVIPNEWKDNIGEAHLGITVEHGLGQYKLTKIVTIRPRFIVESFLDCPIYFRQPGAKDFSVLEPGDTKDIVFLSNEIARLCLRMGDSSRCKWSNPFNISDLGKVYVKLDKVEGASDLVKINIVMNQATLRLQITQVKDQKLWPYQIRNLTDLAITFFQKDAIRWERESGRDPNASGYNTYRLTPRSRMCYAWDYPAAFNRTLVIDVDGRQRAIKLEEIGTLPPMRISETRSLGFDIWASDDGTTQHLDIKYYVESSRSLYRSRTGASAVSALSHAEDYGFVVNKQALSELVKTSIQILLKEGIGISFVNSARRMELAYLSLQDIRIKLQETETEYTSSLEVRWIQIDNQLFGGIYPIILYPTVVPKTEKELADHPIFNLSGVLLKDFEHGVIRFKYLQVLLQEMTAEIDEDFLWALLETLQAVVASFHIENVYESYKLSEAPVQQSGEVVEASGGNFYFEVFLLNPVQLNVSFVRTEAINSDPVLLKEWYFSSRNPLGILINVVTMAGLNINDAPIVFNAVLLEDLHTSFQGLLNQLIVKYRGEAILQVHKVIGSADFIGNPVGLFNNITAGVQDVFYEPYHGIVVGEGIQELGLGLAKGAKSLVQKTVFSLSDSFSKITGSVSKGLSLATLDQKFQAKRRSNRARNRPKHAIGGIASGAKALGTGLLSGVEGLALRPLEGAEREGVGGFLKGVGKGIAGLATKPVVGMFDFASNVSEGVRNTTTLFDRDPLDRFRRPRFIAKDGVVRPFNQFEADGQYALRQISDVKYLREDYVFHMDLPGKEKIVVLTYNRILCITLSSFRVDWDVHLRQVDTINLERTGISIILRDGVTGPFIPCPNKDDREKFFRLLGHVVEDYNSRMEGTVVSPNQSGGGARSSRRT